MSTWSPKASTSIEYFTVDFVRQLAEDDSILACTCSIALLSGSDTAVSSMLVGLVIVDGTTCAQKVQAGVSGCRYQLTFSATTLLGETLTVSGDFAVGTTVGSRDLCLLEDVRSWLGLKTQDDDALLQRLITAQSALIEAWLSRPILASTLTETFYGTGTLTFCPKVSPILSVSAVLVDDLAVDVFNDDLTIWRQDGLRWYANSTIQATYTGGFVMVPADITQACIELVALRYKERERIGHQSKAIGGETVTYSIKAFPDSVKNLLDQYRRVTC